MLTLFLVSLSAQVRYVKNIPLQLPPAYWAAQYIPNQIFPCPDGGVIVLGNYQAHGGSYPDIYTSSDCGAIKLNADGNCEWQWFSRNFSGYGSPEIIGIDQEIDGRVNFLIDNLNYYNQIGWVDPQGNHYLQNIQIPFCFINRAVRLADNSIFAIGKLGVDYTFPNGTFTIFHAYFLHLSAEGDTLSHHDYPPDSLSLWIQTGAWNAEAYDMELDIDGMPVSTCQFTDTGSGVVKTDWDGNLIWRRDTHNQTASSPVSISRLSDTNELVFGYHTNNNNLINLFSVYKITGVGIDSLFTIQLADTTCIGSIYSLVGFNQGIYFAGFYGNFIPPGGDPQIHISSYNIFGQHSWTWSLESPLNFIQTTECTTILPDSCLMYVYGNQLSYNPCLNVIKLHTDGTEIEDVLLPKPNLEINAYPNPMKSSIFIVVNLSQPNKEHKANVNIFNVKGQLVRTLQLNNTSKTSLNTTWDGKDQTGNECANGTYIIKSHIDKSFITKKLLLIK
jgi:hypothetical protein